jgi:hypothetical protein
MLWVTPELKLSYDIKKYTKISGQRTVRYEKQRCLSKILCKSPLPMFIKTFLSDFKVKSAE